jgi:hypothetical protein
LTGINPCICQYKCRKRQFIAAIDRAVKRSVFVPFIDIGSNGIVYAEIDGEVTPLSILVGGVFENGVLGGISFDGYWC